MFLIIIAELSLKFHQNHSFLENGQISDCCMIETDKHTQKNQIYRKHNLLCHGGNKAIG